MERQGNNKDKEKGGSMKAGIRYLKITVILIFIAFSITQAASLKKWVGYPYFYTTFINYSNSKIKDSGFSLTGYLSLWYGYYNNFQLGEGYTYIKYKQGTDLKQGDFTFVYSNTNQILKKHIITTGFHYISTTDSLTDNGKILILDITHYTLQKKYPYAFKWNLGTSLYYSFYDKNTNFRVFQLTPHSTIKLFSSYKMGALYLDISGTYIRVNKAKEIGLTRKNFYSLETDLRFYKNRASLGVSGWIGTQAFAVKNSGFVVYNLTEKYTGGISLFFGYTLKSGVNLGLKSSINSLREENNKVWQEVITFYIGYYF